MLIIPTASILSDSEDVQTDQQHWEDSFLEPSVTSNPVRNQALASPTNLASQQTQFQMSYMLPASEVYSQDIVTSNFVNISTNYVSLLLIV